MTTHPKEGVSREGLARTNAALCVEQQKRRQLEAEVSQLRRRLQATQTSERRLQQQNAVQSDRLALKRLALTLCARIINLPTAEVGAGIVDALRQVAEFMRVERSVIYRVDDKASALSLMYCWESPEVPNIENFNKSIISDFHAVLDEMRQGKPIHTPKLDELPPLISHWKPGLEAAGIRSFIYLPMLHDGKLVGYLGFTSFKNESNWSEEHIGLLQLLSQILMSVLCRQETEVALRKSEERLRLTIEGVEDGLFDMDLASGEAYLSDYSLRAFGLPPGENVRPRGEWEQRIHPEDRDRMLELAKRHLAGELRVLEAEYRMLQPDGGHTWNHVRARVVEWDEQGKPLRILGVDRVVTDRVEQRQKLRRLETQLAHLGRISAMGVAVAGIAHEVNQPLHAAATFCGAARQALKNGRPDSSAMAEEMCQRVAEQVTRAGDIIRRLREFTRPQTAEFELLDLRSTVREATALMTQVWARPDIHVIMDLAEPIPYVEGDSVQLQQVVVNLLQNAQEALIEDAFEKPTISVCVRKLEDSVEVRVVDNGPHCELDDLDALFEPFYTTKSNGMGTGLSLCRSIMETHQGSIVAERNPFGGMTFSFRLPYSGIAAEASA